ncbi:MAG: hypothetical protein JNL30_11020 [Rubrivivax sp.]|nr:hypothetical protein [Rubrivivax sp.]
MPSMTDADIRAFTPGPAGAADAPAPRHPRRWPWVLLAVCLVFVAAVVAGVLVLGDTLDRALGGMSITVDGERVLALPHGEAAWWAVSAALLAAMVVLVVVPLTLLLALLVVALAVAAAVVVVLAVAALVLSPLWVMALLLWLALREPRRPPPAGAPPTVGRRVSPEAAPQA